MKQQQNRSWMFKFTDTILFRKQTHIAHAFGTFRINSHFLIITQVWYIFTVLKVFSLATSNHAKRPYLWRMDVSSSFCVSIWHSSFSLSISCDWDWTMPSSSLMLWTEMHEITWEGPGSFVHRFRQTQATQYSHQTKLLLRKTSALE